MDNRNVKVSPWFVVGAVASLLIAVAMIAMMVFFAQNPGFVIELVDAAS